MLRYHQADKDALWEEDETPFKIKDNVLIGRKIQSNYVNIGDLILNAFRCRPEFIGQINAETGEQVTFQEMKEKTLKLAIWLEDQGIEKNNVVTICTSNQMLAYVPLLASMYLNLVVNPWDIEYLNDVVRTAYFLKEYEPNVIFIDDEKIDRLEAILKVASCFKKPVFPRIIIINKKTKSKYYESLDSILNSEFDRDKIKMFKCVEQSEICTAIYMFSSNTVRYPGNAFMSYGSFVAASNNQTPVMKPNDVGLWYGSINYSHNLLLTIRAILCYVTVIKSSIFNEETLCQTIEKYKVTWVFLKSNMCVKLTTTNVSKMYNLSSLKKVLFGDTAIRRELHNDLIQSLPNVSIVQVYGLTETGVIAYQRDTGKIGSSGYVSENVQIMFIDLKTKRPVGPNIHGEIWCRTPVMRNPPSNIKMKECKYYEKLMHEGWYYTGDMGYFDEDGDIFVVGKSKYIIKYEGHNISSTTIEEILERHPDVSEAAVIIAKDVLDGGFPKAIVKKMPEAKVTEEDLIEFVDNNLKIDNSNVDIFLRGGVHFLKCKMPHLPNGMVNRMKFQNTKTIRKIEKEAIKSKKMEKTLYIKKKKKPILNVEEEEK